MRKSALRALTMVFAVLLSGVTSVVVPAAAAGSPLSAPEPPELLHPRSPTQLAAASDAPIVISVAGRAAVAGHLLVGFVDGVGKSGKDDVHAKVGQHLASRRQVSPDGGVELIGVDASTSIEELARSYRADKRIRFAEPDYVVRISDTPNDQYFSLQWGLSKIAAPAAWSVSHGSGSVYVAILDSGIFDEAAGSNAQDGLPGHPDLRGKVVADRDFVGSPYGTDDVFGHGSHVAGTVAAATNNSVGVAGAGSQVTRIPQGRRRKPGNAMNAEAS